MSRTDLALRIVIGIGVSAALCGSALAADTASTKPVPTYSKDVSRIFQAKCETCHRPNSIAPMSLQTYEEARPWARSIRSRVALRPMPPWHLDKTVGIQSFKNDRSLSDDEIDTILRWADGGPPQGDAQA